jgi:hypothetical protein
MSFLDAAFTAPPRDRLPPPGLSRRKHLSCCANCGHIPLLESRIESLERENKMLEAALMAVLKTSGALDECPCVILSRMQESRGDEMLADQTASRGSPRQGIGKADHHYTPDSQRDRNDGGEINGASVNALEVSMRPCDLVD